jgi:hypothetical protein
VQYIFLVLLKLDGYSFTINSDFWLRASVLYYKWQELYNWLLRGGGFFRGVAVRVKAAYITSPAHFQTRAALRCRRRKVITHRSSTLHSESETKVYGACRLSGGAPGAIVPASPLVIAIAWTASDWTLVLFTSRHWRSCTTNIIYSLIMYVAPPACWRVEC